MHDIRKQTLWGNLLAGGAGVEYYFGYQLAENDLVAEDFRSRDKSWDYCRIALGFFRENRIPFWQMEGSSPVDGKFLFSKKGEVYLLYLPQGGSASIDLTEAKGNFSVSWFNPRTGGALQKGTVSTVRGGTKQADLGVPPSSPSEDWLAVVRRN
jgi:hypothetical protein